jgi:hypothetical protein
MNPRRLLFLFLAALTVFRLVYITQFELFPDEAYYFQWSQHLDWSYFSKGPGIALIIWLGTHIFGDTVFGIRVFSPLLALGTSLLLYSFTRRLYGNTTAVWTVLLLNFVPIFHAGALIMTIDPISIFFWMAALYTFWLALEKSPAFSAWWPVTGALIGIGFLAKYTNAMQLLSILLLLIFTPRHRREFRQPGFYVLLAVFAVFIVPVIYWNSQHAWITLIHLRARGGLDSESHFKPFAFFEFWGQQLGVYSPLIFLAMMMAFVWAWKKSRAHFKPRFLLAFALPIFALYVTLAIKRPGEPNWTAPATLSLGVLTVVFWQELARTNKWARTYAIVALAIGGIESAIALNTDLLRDAGLPLGSDPGTRARGWQTTAEKVQGIIDAYEKEHGQPVFLIANKYGTAASLAFYLPDLEPDAEGFPSVFVPESAWPENQYYFWPRYDGMVDFTDVAREKLRPNSNLDPTVRADLSAALDALTAVGATPSDQDRQKFLHALKAAAPELGIDEYYTESFGYNPYVGRSALYITDGNESKVPDVLERTFKDTKMIACFDVLRRDHSIRQIRVFACNDYRLLEL